MGYRNLLEMEAADGAADGEVTRRGEGRASCAAPTAATAAGARVICAIRPEDLRPGEGPNAVQAKVVVVEYRGQEHAVEALTEQGTALHLLTAERLVPGDAVTLSADPSACWCSTRRRRAMARRR